MASTRSTQVRRSSDGSPEWRGRVADLYAAGGMTPEAAARFATTVVAATEGAVFVSRAEQSLEPFELVAEELLASIPGGRSSAKRAEGASEQTQRPSRARG
jgi:hypothetical protein